MEEGAIRKCYEEGLCGASSKTQKWAIMKSHSWRNHNPQTQKDYLIDRLLNLAGCVRGALIFLRIRPKNVTLFFRITTDRILQR